ncbi:MAG: hypothetical protein ABJG88_10825 [Litorimonas sp.]
MVDNTGTGYETISLSEYSQTLSHDINALKHDDTLDPSLENLIQSPAPYALARTLQNGDVGTIEVPVLTDASAEVRLRGFILSGNEAIETHNLPKPHLQDYYAAQEIAGTTGHELTEVLESFEAIRPMEVGVYDNSQTQFSADTSPNYLTAPEGQNVAVLEGVEPQNYQEYDVHLMAYPLAQKDIPFTDLSIVSRDSHAYVVITEKGAELIDENGNINEEAALLVTRAGPDDVGILGSSRSSDSSFSDEQNPTDEDKGKDGDVYVTSLGGSEADLTVKNSFTLQKVTITGNLGEIEGQLNDFRNFINEQDINYELLNRNSNTYAGDVYELLTGEEPNNTHAGLFGRRTPALDNDLVNYENTGYANGFE